MSVYRPKDKAGNEKSPFFHFDFTIKVNGESRRFHGTTGEKALGRAKAFEEAEKRRVRSAAPNDHLTLDDCIGRYMDEVLAQKPSGIDTAIGFQHCARLIGGERRLINVTADDIALACQKRAGEVVGKDEKTARPISGATVNRNVIEPMRALMFHASRAWGMTCRPHTIDWKALRRREKPARDRELSEAEARAFWEALREDFIPFTTFQFERGFRLQAALGLKKLDVDVPNRRVRIWIKGHGEKWQRVSRADIALLEREMGKSPLPCVWTYEVQRGPKKGMRLPLTVAGYRRSFETALRQAGIADFRRHDMRHDFATKLLRATRDLALVKKALGHSDISSTMRYAHVLDDDVGDALDAIPRTGPGEVFRSPRKSHPTR
ncbi:tyrosine-type recombinase/integrase [Aureimonas phyllosphaerae]|uniref:tyrosine-type recombinase/integrase n=1 Tax=Aureimonas phyllosphaerae TaxID=1166078 RepID=UPI003A5C4BFB